MVAAVLFPRFHLKGRRLDEGWDESRVNRDWRGRFAPKLGADLVPDVDLGPSRAGSPPKVQVQVSQRTRNAVAAARKSLPRTANDWDNATFTKLQPQRKIDHDLEDARWRLDEAERHLETYERWLDGPELPSKAAEEYRQRKRGDRRHLDTLRKRVDLARKVVADLEEKLDSPDLDDEDLRMLPAGEVRRLRTDPNGQILPPLEFERHLDSVLDVGRGVLNDAKESLTRNSEYRQLARRVRVGDLSPEAIAEVDDPAEKQRLANERADAARRLREIESATLQALLRELRSFGGVRHTKVKTLKTARDDWQERLQRAEQMFPDDWLRLSAAKPMSVGSASRAYHLGTASGSTLAMPDRERFYRGAFADSTDEVTVHEMGHRMEMVVPGLKELEFAFVRRRATHRGVMEPARRLKDADSGASYDEDEVTFEDEWASPYAGKTYEQMELGSDGALYAGEQLPWRQAWEVFQVGLQDTFGREIRWDTGEELRAFTLGILATLSYED